MTNISDKIKSPRDIEGYIHSFQSMGTVDGPGVRAVVFLQGCPLRCSCCHNPDTWNIKDGKRISAGEIFDKIERLKRYYVGGGVTLSGGEPLLQSEFAGAILALCKQSGLHTALDTSGCILDGKAKKLLEYCDLVLLDYKYTNKDDYLKHTGMQMESANTFLDYLQSVNKPTLIRQVIIPTVNDNEESVKRTKALTEKYPCIEKVEFLPFRKLCIEKYRRLDIPFPFEHINEAPLPLCAKQ